MFQPETRTSNSGRSTPRNPQGQTQRFHIKGIYTGDPRCGSLQHRSLRVLIIDPTLPPAGERTVILNELAVAYYYISMILSIFSVSSLCRSLFYLFDQNLINKWIIAKTICGIWNNWKMKLYGDVNNTLLVMIKSWIICLYTFNYFFPNWNDRIFTFQFRNKNAVYTIIRLRAVSESLLQ